MAHSMQLQAIEGRLQKALEHPGRSGFLDIPEGDPLAHWSQ